MRSVLRRIRGVLTRPFERVLRSFEPPFTGQRRAYRKYDIGAWTYGAPDIQDWGGATVRIGKFCSIAQGVTILLGGEHRVEWVSTYPFDAFVEKAPPPYASDRGKGDVVIGNDVWIGREALILSGVKVGDGAVIASRAVVVKDVPPYAIVGGNPAKVIRFRFEPGQIEALLQLRWWDWPIERIRQSQRELMAGDIDGFIARHGAEPVGGRHEPV